MVVDDAVVVRSLIARWISEEPGLEVVASLRSGREAVDQIEKVCPDVIILDIEMPDIDGLTALPLLLARKPDVAVIIASTLTRRNAEIGLKALASGALDCMAKPDTTSAMMDPAAFRRQLIEKIKHLGARWKKSQARTASPLPAVKPAAPRTSLAITDKAPPRAITHSAPEEIKLRPFSIATPRVLVIGASTGGPPALLALMSHLEGVADRAPILITQHIPPTFTTILAEHIGRASGRPTREAQDGEPILAGTIYIAPGGKHMRVTRRDGAAVIALDDGPPVNFCKPAVDPLFTSAAKIWNSWVLGVVLTGMGSDGTLGASAIVGAGGSIIAQDEATSVVWGMPGSAATAGLCSAVLPLHEIASRIVHVFAGERT
ncbi:MAG: chemotaxis response regulator protein-glutamate methylesterase [Rhizobiales bacterium]|nr:chemotaxis response regulator protein-glutamate methylesterase [Hyphomicrobiales bacterium]